MEHFNGEILRHMGELPAMAASRYPDKTAFIFYGQEVTYKEFNEEANKVANMLTEHGVEPGDRVGLFIPNSLLFPPAYFGAIKAGAVSVPLNLRMDPETLVYVVQNAEINHIIGSDNLADQVKNLADAGDVDNVYIPNDEDVIDYQAEIDDQPDTFDMPDRDYEDVAAQPYTSGTTGKPKGVLLTNENLLTTIEAYDNGGLPIDPDDSILLVLPLFHIYGLNALLGTYIYTGGMMVMQSIPNPNSMLNAIDQHELTAFAGVPAMYNMMLRTYEKKPDDFNTSSLEYVVCAAAPLAEDTRRRVEQALNVNVVEGWGMTETGPAGTAEPTRGIQKEAGCIGPPVPNIEIKLVDTDTRETKVSPEDLEPKGMADSSIDFDDRESVTGEIAIRGPPIFEGYYKLPEKNQEVFDDDDWFYTDDIARVDSDGYFWMVDRADDMIIAGGENIYPAEVENALYEHRSVAEAAVVAAPHEIKGEAPVAFVVLEDDADVSEEELRKFSLDHVATYAHPRRIFFVDELPRSATQKVQRYKLEDEAQDRLGGALESSEEI